MINNASYDATGVRLTKADVELWDCGLREMGRLTGESIPIVRAETDEPMERAHLTYQSPDSRPQSRDPPDLTYTNKG
jgi:hypothetical protein